MLGLLIAAAAWLPNVPGAANPAVTPDTLATTICSKGKDAAGATWIRAQRPPLAYTEKIKHHLMKAAGIPLSKASLYELDHLHSIGTGGDPRSTDNLWLQPWAGKWGARKKDRLEVLLNKLICNGTVTLDEAGRELSVDWTAAYRKRIPH